MFCLAVQEERKPVTPTKPDDSTTPNKETPISVGIATLSPSTPDPPSNLSGLPPRYASLPNLPYNSAQSQGRLGSRSQEDFAGDPTLTLEALQAVEIQIGQPSPRSARGDRKVTTDEVFQSAKESLIRIIDWSKHVPAFSSLPIPEQVKILKMTWAEVMMLRLSVRTAHAQREGVRGIVLANGRAVLPEESDDSQLAFVFSKVQEELTNWFVAENIDNAELTLLQAVILFNPGEQHSKP